MDRRRRLLTRLEGAWIAFNASYAGLTDTELLTPGVTGEWSVRDIIAHVTTWEEEALKHLPLIMSNGTPPRYSVQYGGIDAFNARMTDAKRGLSLDEVRAQAAATHARLVDFLERAPEHQLSAGTRVRRRLRLDTYGHYPLHAEAIRQWRPSDAGGPQDPHHRETLYVTGQLHGVARQRGRSAGAGLGGVQDRQARLRAGGLLRVTRPGPALAEVRERRRKLRHVADGGQRHVRPRRPE